DADGEFLRFSFFMFENFSSINVVMLREYSLDRNAVLPKRAIRRWEDLRDARSFAVGFIDVTVVDDEMESGRSKESMVVTLRMTATIFS
ncbi:hypothetical protein EI94DRAFT_1598744, partial [Lactarius quietus]